MPNKTKKESREKLAVGAGFALIVLVGAVTILRSVDFGSSEENASPVSSKETGEKYGTISAPDLQKKITSSPATIALLDIRSGDSYIEEHAIDSLSIPIGDLESDSSLDARKQIFLIGENSEDKDVDKAFAILAKKGLRNVTVLAGGLESWKNLGGQTVTSGDPTSFVNQAKVRSVTAEELQASLDGGKIFLIDARSQKDFSEGHIKNAINIPFEELEKRRSEIPLSKTIAVYDANEVLGFQSTARIYDLVSIPAYNLKGGLDGWKEKGLEMVK